MMNKEKKLILSIKIVPIITILIFSILATTLSIIQNNIYFEKKINKLHIQR